MNATVDKLVISPIGYNFSYTVAEQAKFEDAPSGKAPQSQRDTWDTFSVPLSVTLKDGTVIDLNSTGGSMEPDNGETVCTRMGTFDTILPLDEVASVTIGDTTIPVK